MTPAQINAAAYARTRNQPAIPVKDRRGRKIGTVRRNRYGLWEVFRGEDHQPGSHLSARDAVATLRTA